MGNHRSRPPNGELYNLQNLDLEPIHNAVIGGEAETVRLILTSNRRLIDKPCYRGRPIHLALRYHHLNVLKVLLEFQPSLGHKPEAFELLWWTQKPSSRSTPTANKSALHFALTLPESERHDQVFEHMAERHRRDQVFEQMVELVLEAGGRADEVLVEGRQKVSLLQVAVTMSSTNIVKILLEHGAQVNEAIGASSALELACQQQKKDVALLLLAHGATVAPLVPHATGFIRAFLSEDRRDILTALFQRSKDEAEAAAAAAAAAAAGTGTGGDQVSIPAPAFHVNCCNENKSNCLHIAAKTGRVDEIRVLLSLGGDVNAVNDDGNTPLHLAALWHQVEAARALIEGGASMYAPNELQNNHTPLDTIRKNSPVREAFQDIIDEFANDFIMK